MTLKIVTRPRLKAYEGELWPFTSPETVALGLYVALWLGVILGIVIERVTAL